MTRWILSFLWILVLTPALFADETTAGEAIEKGKLVGDWQFKDGQHVAAYHFRADGTFSAELKQGEDMRKFEGQWSVEWIKQENVLIYKFTGDSTGNVVGGEERDRLVRVDESSYTIQAGDGNQRTYWRMK